MAAETRRKSITILWGILGVVVVFLAVVRIANRPLTSVRGPLKMLTPPFTANKAELILELRNREFQVLDARLNSYQKAFEGNALEEGDLSIAFDAFSFADPALSPILDEWVKNEPASYPAHLARAKHLLALGWQARGNRFADKTSEQQFREMGQLMGESVKEADTAINMNPKSSIGYGLIIDAAKSVSDYKTMERAYAASLKNVPLSLSTRVAFLAALRPRWGGSFEAMEKFAGDAQKYAVRNPRLVSLKGFADVERGNVAWDDGNLKQAVLYYSQALDKGGDFAAAYSQRGSAYERLHRNDDALEDLSRANRLRPQEPYTLQMLAYVYAHLDRPKDTLATIQEYQQFAMLPSDLVNLERWAENFGAGSAPPVKTGGN